MAASDKGSTAQGAVEASEKYDVADEFYTEGVARLQEGDYAEASNCLSQSLQAKSELFGENSLEAALVSVKYGLALLESFRAQRSERDAEPVCLRSPCA
jgi:outer membrane protein assembly factor BamD (BamD/ComL family)